MLPTELFPQFVEVSAARQPLVEYGHQAIKHLTADLSVGESKLLVVHAVGLAGSGAENFLNELLDFLLIVHAVPIVGVSAFALQIQALRLFGS